MSATKAMTFRSGFEQARQRLDDWRATRTAGTPIPDSLWAAAVKLARRHGVYRTARTLGLEYKKLKRLSQPAEPSSAALAPGFVELFAPQPSTSACRIELQGAGGATAKIELPAGNAALVLEVCRVILGAAP